ncbi:MAG: hypothetical protein ABI203_03855 [Mucilaginibacter sp.]
MKIRIKGNSLRYRLTKTDVEIFLSEGYLEDVTHFGEHTLTYALQRTSAENLSASFTNNKITLFMPDQFANTWNSPNKVGFEGQSDQLFLLIEKDFKCLDDVAEDQSDNYPNPHTL